MSNATESKTVARKSKAVVVTGQAGTPVNLAQTVAALTENAALRRENTASDVITVHEYLTSNGVGSGPGSMTKRAAFDALVEGLGGKDNNVISSSSLYRYATIGEILAGHRLPISGATVAAAYRLTESNRTDARKAVTAAKGASVKDAAAFNATVNKAITATIKATPPAKGKGKDTASTVSAKRQSVAAWLKSIADYLEGVTPSQAATVAAGLQKYAVQAANLAPAQKIAAQR